MEFNFLYWLQGLHNPFLDRFMVLIFNDIVGSKGQLWVVLGIILLIIPKTRKTGICVLLSYALSLPW